MLEIPYKNLVDHILAVENSHKNDPAEAAMLSRNWEFIFQDFEGWVVLGLSTDKHQGYWIHPRLYPESRINELKQTLPAFNFNTPSSAYSEVMQGDNHWIEPYWGENDSFTNSEIDLYYARHYYGRPKGQERYLEFNQVVTHSLGLEWSETKQSYCVLNDLGEETEKIKIIKDSGMRIILMRRHSLDKLLYLGKWVLIQYASFSRWRTEHPDFDTSTYTNFDPPEYEARFEIRKCGKDKLEYTEIRGAAIQRPTTPKNKLLGWDASEEEEDKQYGEFIVQDWKNQRLLKNYSINPSNFANYFTKSDLPFETSPIFFKAEVLDKYKNNPDKYGLTERSINCRGGWELKTYDVNEHNQVHTYAVYLSRLPYKEQLYWLQYNENPKGSISKQAFRTDFEAQWPEEASPLEKLKSSLEHLSKVAIGGVSVWEPKGGKLETAAKGLYYVHTENQSQWHDFIIALANTTNEGFQKAALTTIATKLGDVDRKLGTLGLIKYILVKTGNEAHLPVTHAILSDLQEKRGQGKAHGAWIVPEGSLIEDAKTRLRNVIEAISKLTDIFKTLSQGWDS